MGAKKDFRDITGVLLLDKMEGRSSNGEMQVARRLFRARKAGHTGTLDPQATGLLPVCFGEATKFSQHYIDKDKEYVSVSKLGEATDTLDKEGVVTRSVPLDSITPPTREEVEEVLKGFLGESEQTPPMHSALKHEGRRLYEYAHQGIDIERKKRKITVSEIELLEWDFPHAKVRTRCSKGTYIRTLMSDVFEALGLPSHLSALRRVGTGGFNVSEAHDLRALEAMDEKERDSILLPVDSLVLDFPKVVLSDEDSLRLLSGREAAFPQNQFSSPVDISSHGEKPIFRAYSADRGLFIGLVQLAGGILKAERMMNLTRADFD